MSPGIGKVRENVIVGTAKVSVRKLRQFSSTQTPTCPTAACCGELITAVWTVSFTITKPVSRHTGMGALAAEHVGRTGGSA